MASYYHTYETYVKLRWKNKEILGMLVKEFKSRDEEYYREALRQGVVTVNNKIVSAQYKLKDLDVIRHTVHIHEPEVTDIEIIADEDEYSVIHKPAGVPVHPTGGYYHYSVTKHLYKDEKVGCVNRLDMPVSGVLIIARKNHEEKFEMLKSARKIYIAKVKGLFPEYEEVDQPIGTEEGRSHRIMAGGKPSKTIFRRLKYENGYSLVECQPITGRTHQIRIHITFLGFPIENDIIYGDGCEPEQVIYEDKRCNEKINENELPNRKFIIDNCKGENNRTYLLKNSFICLHAWKYTFNGKEYCAKWPEWAYF
ncbi:tRNA pseudouridine32 synthase [Enteropsectra breve]|nr:tRNA pseudouridine32 synthase [Enteropsectra breve]